MQLGVHAGANVNILSTSLPDFTTQFYPGARAGIFTRINLGLLNVTPEINFSMTGGEGVFANDPNRYYSSKTNTLEIPVLIGLRLVKGKLVNLRTQFGGFWAWNISNTIFVKDHVFSQNDSLITSSRGSNFNGGIVLGLGLDIWRFNLEMRYQWGLANLLGSNVIYQDPRAGLRYSGFSVTLGFSFYQKQF
jgi:hypothetical protein